MTTPSGDGVPRPPRSSEHTVFGRTLVVQPRGVLALLTMLTAAYASVLCGMLDHPVAELLPSAVLLVVVVASSMLLHEAGHGLAALSTGRAVTGLFVGAGAAVYLDNNAPPRGRERVIITVAGPLTGLVFDSAIIGAAVEFGHMTPIWIAAGGAALFTVILNLSNLIIPMGHNSDGMKLYRGIAELRQANRSRRSPRAET